MSANEEEANPYELIGVGLEATEAEIKTAYRQRSLKVHPDRVCYFLCLYYRESQEFISYKDIFRTQIIRMRVCFS